MASDALTHYRRGNEHRVLAQWDAALAEYDIAVSLDPGFANAFCNRGVALEQLGKLEDALASYDQTIKLDPLDALAFYNRGAVLVRLERLRPALDDFDQAISLRPGYAEAHFNRAVLLHQLQRWDEATAGFHRAMELNPAFAGEYTWYAVAAGCMKMRQWQPALDSLDRVLAIRGDHVEALQGRGLVLHELRRYEEAVVSLNAALALQPGLEYLVGVRSSAKMHICDWHQREADIARLTAGICALHVVSPPFPLLALLESAPLQRTAAELWARDHFPYFPDEIAAATPSGNGRIRVGYFSADFRVHPVALLMSELFEIHDRSKFEIIAFAFGPKPDELIQARLARTFDRFIDVRAMTDAQVAALARSLGIDIAVDLGGYTEYNRTGIFALRAAPLQLSYIGYPGTMGAPFIDYLVADATIVPAADRVHYSEKIIYLPSFQANHTNRVIGTRQFTRQDLGLPAQGFVFTCCNSSYKIGPATFDAWMRILGRVDRSVLFLNADNAAAARNLRAEAQRRGVDPSRIVFGERLALPEYLARYQTLDLFLDTSPYNAGTTASDALWVGLPVLTMRGKTFAGRMAASLLHAMDVAELVTDSAADYEDLAVQLATDPARLSQLRERLVQRRTSSQLYDTRTFAAHLESAYSRIVARFQRGLPADHLLPDPKVIVD